MKTSRLLTAVTAVVALMGVAMGAAEARPGDRDHRGDRYDHRDDHRGGKHYDRSHDRRGKHYDRSHDRRGHYNRGQDRHGRYDHNRHDRRIYRHAYKHGKHDRRYRHKVKKSHRHYYHDPVRRYGHYDYNFYIGGRGFHLGYGHNAYGRHYGRYYRHGCHQVERIGYWRGYEALIGGTMCYDHAGYGYVLPSSRYLIHYVY